MTNNIALFMIWAMTLSCLAVSSSANVPFHPNWVALSRMSKGPGQLVRDVIDPDEELMMESESARRILAGRGYISYGAMQKNNVPCNQRGRSYYDCNSKGQANPYNRGCNIITRNIWLQRWENFVLFFGDDTSSLKTFGDDICGAFCGAPAPLKVQTKKG
ncbi:rapid alkalinization factor-like [Rutidosis leptorrhynchoides]|uniref:rapid alkalinization factor-like n=1 Tax=Rutidosis leptorrhynchoides TaxID=125765 RepID=UPI003A993234